MDYRPFHLLMLCSLCLRGTKMQSTMNNNGEFTHNELQILSQLDDDVDLRYVNWPLVIPMLLQRQQLRLCMAIYRYDMLVVENTPCETLLASVMADCDIGNIEDISLTVRDAFGSMLFDTMQKCRPGLEIFGVRCRRRA